MTMFSRKMRLPKDIAAVWRYVHSGGIMTHVEQLTPFLAEVAAYAAEEGIAPSTFTNQVLGSTYALPRMLSKAEGIDSAIERLRDAMADSPHRAFLTVPPPTDDGLRRTMRFDLPVPPSTNKLTATVSKKAKHGDHMVMKRVPSQSLESWKKTAGQEILLQRAGLAKKALPSNQPYVTRIRVAAGDAADISNRIKALEDLLVDMGITPDDRFQLHLSIGRSGAVPSGRLHVTVRSVPIQTANLGPK